MKRLLQAGGLVAALLLNACAHHNVIFKPDDQGKPFSIYLDRNGDLYPRGAELPSGLSWKRGQMLCSVLHREGTKLTTGDLELQKRLIAFQDVSLADDSECYGESQPSGWVNRWEAIQDYLWSRQIAELRNLLAVSGDSSRPREVVILIHGFNSDQTATTASYLAAEARLKSRARDAVFVEVYWDGLVNNSLIGQYVNVPWAAAQFNGPLVGVRLRYLLNHIPDEVPVRILTHSSGGIVAASLIGDATGAFPARNRLSTNCRRELSPYCGYAQDVASDDRGNPYRVPQLKDLRIGMLAAATPSLSFAYPDCPQMGPLTSNTTLIFGMNPEDAIITKALGLEQVSMLGAATMGTGGKNFGSFREVRSALAQRQGVAPSVKVFGFDFSGSQPKVSGPLGIRESHDFKVYLQREAFSTFASVLFEGDEKCVLGTDQLCKLIPHDPPAQNAEVTAQ